MQEHEHGWGQCHVCCVVGRHSDLEAWMLMVQKLVCVDKNSFEDGIFKRSCNF